MPDCMAGRILSIAGSDPSGGAGIQADIKTITMLDGYAMAVPTALTAQNTQGVTDVLTVSPQFFQAQLDAVLSDIAVDAIKVGMLGDAYIAAALADTLAHLTIPYVLDPVMVATSGDRLIDEATTAILKDDLAPNAALITPNIPEGEALLKQAILDTEKAATALSAQFDGAPVLLKGGHMTGDTARDVLCAGGRLSHYNAPRLQTDKTHGTGCTLSSAIATRLGQGATLIDAVIDAKTYVTKALQAGVALEVGCGCGPLDHTLGRRTENANG